MIYTDGGSCGYLQNISFIRLNKANEMAETSTTLYICDFEAGPCSPRIGSVTFSRGSYGLEFILTLFNVTTDSTGAYEVIVGTLHQGYCLREQSRISVHKQIKKKYIVGK